jgi:hypothetical protein
MEAAIVKCQITASCTREMGFASHVTAKSPRGNRQSPKDCGYKKDTKIFH